MKEVKKFSTVKVRILVVAWQHTYSVVQVNCRIELQSIFYFRFSSSLKQVTINSSLLLANIFTQHDILLFWLCGTGVYKRCGDSQLAVQKLLFQKRISNFWDHIPAIQYFIYHSPWFQNIFTKIHISCLSPNWMILGITLPLSSYSQ